MLRMAASEMTDEAFMAWVGSHAVEPVAQT